MAGSVNVLDEAHGQKFAAYRADCIDFLRQMPDDSIGMSIYSPPFSDLFVYSSSIADMGNSSSNGEFAEHYRFCAEELLRVTKPGRWVAVHCSDLPVRKWVEGHVALYPFSDEISRIHAEAGWLFHCRITIRRDPVIEMQRTKALGLLYKQLQKDSAMSRVGMADYVMVFRKPGDNAEPVGHKPADFPVDLWQQWAEPVWMDIDQTKTLNARLARENDDERHLCPLQLDLIERAIVLSSNPGDTVFSPFMGIGSEGVVALQLGRRFIGTELKDSYFRIAERNLHDAEKRASMPTLLDLMEGTAA